MDREVLSTIATVAELCFLAFMVGTFFGAATVAKGVHDAEETPCAKRARLAAERKVMNDNG